MTIPATEQPAAVAPAPRRVASRKARSKKAPSKKRAAPKAKRAAKSAKPRKATAKKERSKNDIILSLIGRKGGATLAAIMKATDWQAHSVRGFISLAQSKRGLKVASTKSEKGERVYRAK